MRRLVAELGVPAIEGVPAGHEDGNFALPLGPMVTVVAPAPGEAGRPASASTRGRRRDRRTGSRP